MSSLTSNDEQGRFMEKQSIVNSLLWRLDHLFIQITHRMPFPASIKSNALLMSSKSISCVTNSSSRSSCIGHGYLNFIGISFSVCVLIISFSQRLLKFETNRQKISNSQKEKQHFKRKILVINLAITSGLVTVD